MPRNPIYRSMLVMFILFSMLTLSLQARPVNIGEDTANWIFDKNGSSTPNTELREHLVGNTKLTITNYGMFGFPFLDEYINPETGLPVVSCEHPPGSKIKYLFQGALWIGAIVNDDTLVSVGADGWHHVYEMLPAAVPGGGIEKRSTIPSDPDYHPDAISEADYIAVYYDTLTDPAFISETPFDDRPHIPLGLEITQSSYSWSNSEYEDFIIFRYKVKNISDTYLEDMVFGLYNDTDIMHYLANPGGSSDDLSGHFNGLDQKTGESVPIAWSADNDGDPNGLNWDFASARGVFGVSILDFPQMQHYGFNWWISDEDHPIKYDWSPMKAENYRDYETGGMGTPEGDCNKYYIMSNEEIDYDQLFTARDYTGDGWLPHPTFDFTYDIINGYETKFLLSFGPANLQPGESVSFAFVLAIGDDFHQNPQDFIDLFEESNPEIYYNSLDFTDLVDNVVTARNLYDSIFMVEYTCGDANHNGLIEISDVVYIINYIFVDGIPPYPMNAGDVNCDEKINLIDIIYLINYIFRGGNEPGDINGDGLPDC